MQSLMQYTIRPLLLSLLFCMLGGMCNAAMDKVSFHYDRSIFSQRGDPLYYNPQLSWKNKWKTDAKGEVIPGVERFPGSSTVFVKFTDFWHLAKSGMLVCVFLAVVCYRRITENLAYRGIDFLLCYVVFTGTFSFCFDWLFVLNA